MRCLVKIQSFGSKTVERGTGLANGIWRYIPATLDRIRSKGIQDIRFGSGLSEELPEIWQCWHPIAFRAPLRIFWIYFHGPFRVWFDINAKQRSFKIRVFLPLLSWATERHIPEAFFRFRESIYIIFAMIFINEFNITCNLLCFRCLFHYADSFSCCQPHSNIVILLKLLLLYSPLFMFAVIFK